jgi:hypothetical protein
VDPSWAVRTHLPALCAPGRRLYPPGGPLVQGVTGEVLCVRKEPDLTDLTAKLQVRATAVNPKNRIYIYIYIINLLKT